MQYCANKMDDVNQSCGCKGARYCAACVTSDRVQSLRMDSKMYDLLFLQASYCRFNTDDVLAADRNKLNECSVFVYCIKCMRAFRVDPNTFDLCNAALIEEFATKQCQHSESEIEVRVSCFQ